MGRTSAGRYFQLTFSQLGPKWSKGTYLEMVLDAHELAEADWISDPPRAFRRGAFSNGDPIARRARRSKCVVIWGHFRRLDSSREILIKVGPVASTEDAQAWVASFRQRMLEGIEMIDAAADESLEIDHELGNSVTTIDTASVAYTVRREREGNRTFLDLAGNVGNVYFTVSCSSVDDGWTWDQVVSIANSQLEKIKVSSGRNYRHQL